MGHDAHAVHGQDEGHGVIQALLLALALVEAHAGRVEGEDPQHACPKHLGNQPQLAIGHPSGHARLAQRGPGQGQALLLAGHHAGDFDGVAHGEDVRV